MKNNTKIAYIVFKKNTSNYFIVDKDFYERTIYRHRNKYIVVFDVEYTSPNVKFHFTPLKNKPYNQNIQPILDEVGIK